LPLKPAYLLLAGAGAIVAVAGVKGWGISSTLRDIISGQNPSANPTLASQIAATNYGYGASTSGGGSGAAGLAGIAQSHIGFPYTWGGAPASGSTDCSGFVNMCCAQAGLAIPGYAAGKFTGKSHGPNTLVWLAWPGTSRIPTAQAEAGDLAVWQTHMGIIVGGGQMVSDLNPSIGTRQTTIQGAAPPGEILVVERFRAGAVAAPSGVVAV